MTIPMRQLAGTDVRIAPIALGCWPIAGMTSLHVNDKDSLETIAAALDAGINMLDTAYCYGPQGESERLIGQVIRGRRDSVVLATKGGIHWDLAGNRILDARPETLRRQCQESLQRLATDRVELLYLHAPDPQVDIRESAGALLELRNQGKTRAVGLSNATLEQVQAFHQVCPLGAVQPPFNMLQRQVEDDILPWCQRHDVSCLVYWPLMKGLLAGKLPRGFRFEEGDGRAKYPMFQGEEWQKNQDFLDRLRSLAAEIGRSVPEVVINWTIHRPGITAALCGAKRPQQIRETAAALTWQLDPQQLAAIDQAIQDRGQPVVGKAV